MIMINPIQPGDKMRIVTTPTSKIGKVPSRAKVQANNDARRRDDYNKGILPAKNQYKLHTLTEIGYDPISASSLKELILEFNRATGMIPNVYYTNQAFCGEKRYKTVYLKELGAVSVRFKQAVNGQRVGLV